MIRLLSVVMVLVASPRASDGGATPETRQSGRRYQLDAVQTEGLKRFTQAQVLAMTGLRPGRDVGQNEVEAARQRLVQSGLFVSVGYRFRVRGSRTTVVFTAEESPWKTPVVFDNFVDHTEAELIRCVASDLPTFDGVTPDHPRVLA